MSTTIDTELLAQAASAELARRRLLDFCALMYPQFQAKLHLRKLADILERVERDEIKRVIVSLHPGAGKSTLLQYFAAWYLGRNPKRKIVATSATERLVVRNSRAVRDCFAEEIWPFDAKLAADATAQTQWETSVRGGLYGVGVGGAITGWRAPLLLCDDLEDGQSTKLELDNLEDWYRNKALTRLEPSLSAVGEPERQNDPDESAVGAVVIVQTRWPNDDLPRRLMKGPRGDQWLYVRMPALAEDDDPLGRQVGEPLWPERFSKPMLEAMREQSPRHFAAQYQGAPLSDDGNVLRSEWFGRYELADLPSDLRVVCALDCASKTGVSNDYSAIVTLGIGTNRYYVLDVVRRRVEYPDLLRMVKMAHEKHEPSHIYAEDASSGIALIQQLQNESLLPIIAVKPLGSKLSRVEAISGKVEAGKVYLPNSAPWLAEFESELCEFPAGNHDDMVDAFTMALSQSMNNNDFFYFSEVGSAEGDAVDETSRKFGARQEWSLR